MEEVKMVEATQKLCKTCKYRDSGIHTTKNGRNTTMCSCNYISVTGRMRIRDESGDLCGSYEKGKRVRTKVGISLG